MHNFGHMRTAHASAQTDQDLHFPLRESLDSAEYINVYQTSMDTPGRLSFTIDKGENFLPVCFSTHQFPSKIVVQANSFF